MVAISEVSPMATMPITMVRPAWTPAMLVSAARVPCRKPLAITSVTNLASRLCDEAKAGQIVVSRRVYGMVEEWVDMTPLDDLHLKGFNHPVLAVEILRWREGAANVTPLRRKAPS